MKDGNVKPIKVETSPYPGFATDLQPQLSVLMLLASGNSEITENIFEDRFKHIGHLIRMGANIEFINKKKILIKGGNLNLKGDSVQGTDLRACAALAMAGILANGETAITNAESIDRGYYKFVKNINGCGGKMERYN